MNHRCAIGLLACLLIFDIGTPLLPGAFRFNPDESIDVLCAHSARAAAFAADSLPSRGPRERLTAPHSSAKAAPHGAMPQLRREKRLPRRISSASPDCSSTSSEDH